MSKFYKYQDNIAKENSDVVMNSAISVLVQDPNTFTHLPMPVSKKELVSVEVKESKFEDFFDILDNEDAFSNIIQEAITLHDRSKGVKNMMGLVVEEANDRNVWLTDLHDYDYETNFFKIIKDYRL